MTFEIKILIVLFIFCLSLFLRDKTRQMQEHTKNYDVFVRERLKRYRQANRKKE